MLSSVVDGDLRVVDVEAHFLGAELLVDENSKSDAGDESDVCQKTQDHFLWLNSKELGVKEGLVFEEDKEERFWRRSEEKVRQDAVYSEKKIGR